MPIWGWILLAVPDVCASRAALVHAEVCVVNVSPASVRGMSIGNDPTARR